MSNITSVLLYFLIYSVLLWDNKTGIVQQSGVSLLTNDSTSISSFKPNNNNNNNNHLISNEFYKGINGLNYNYNKITRFNDTSLEYTEEFRLILDSELKQFVKFIEQSTPTHYLYKPIYSRVKTVDSMVKKEIKRSNAAESPVHWTEIFDSCGIAMIIHPNYSTAIVVDQLRELEILSNNTFKIIEIDKKTNIFGYRAYHLDIEFTTNLFTTKIEIQIRSIYEDIVNNLTHDAYKQIDKTKPNQPQSLPKQLELKSFLLYMAETSSKPLYHNSDTYIDSIYNSNAIDLLK